MENNTSPQHGGNIPKKDRTPMSFLKTHTPDASPESQYPPATEQPEEGYVVGLRAGSFESVCQVVTENQVLQAKLAASEKRVKALESENETLRERVEWLLECDCVHIWVMSDCPLPSDDNWNDISDECNCARKAVEELL